MEPEIYQHLRVKIESDRETLRDNIQKTVQEQYQAQLDQLGLNTTEQLYAAQHSPAYGNNQRTNVRNQIREQQTEQHQALLAEIEAEEKRLYDEKNAMLESVYFEDYGGSQASAKELVQQYEETKRQEASQSLQSEWQKEHHVQAAQDIKHNDNQDERPTSQFNDHAEVEERRTGHHITFKDTTFVDCKDLLNDDGFQH